MAHGRPGRLRRRRRDSHTVIGATFSIAAIALGATGLVLPLPLGLAGIMLGIFGLLLSPGRTLSTVGILVPAAGFMAGVIIGLMLGRG